MAQRKNAAKNKKLIVSILTAVIVLVLSLLSEHLKPLFEPLEVSNIKIESEFSVAKGRENTAVTGFSMGGRESLFIGFSRPDLFGYIGSVCAAPGLVEIPGSPMHPGQMKEEEMKFSENDPFIIFISSSKTDGVVGNNPDNYRRIMSENEVEYLSHVMERTGHDHTSVKPHLYNFLKMLFR